MLKGVSLMSPEEARLEGTASNGSLQLDGWRGAGRRLSPPAVFRWQQMTPRREHWQGPELPKSL